MGNLFTAFFELIKSMCTVYGHSRYSIFGCWFKYSAARELDAMLNVTPTSTLPHFLRSEAREQQSEAEARPWGMNHKQQELLLQAVEILETATPRIEEVSRTDTATPRYFQRRGTCFLSLFCSTVPLSIAKTRQLIVRCDLGASQVHWCCRRCRGRKPSSA